MTHTRLLAQQPGPTLDTQVVFAVTGNSCYYRIYRRLNSCTYRAELKAQDGYHYRCGFATIADAEAWAIRRAEETK